MKKLFLFVPVILLTVLVLAALMFMQSQGQVARASTELVFFEHATAIKQITVGTATDLRGNYVVFYDPLFDAANQHQVGNVNGTCVNTSNTMEECRFTIILQKGQITLEGPEIDTTSGSYVDDTFSVTGGTGIYNGAEGQLVQKTLKTAAGLEFKFSLQIH
ncbi:MAG: hypothetical protein JO202_14440 [Ktedonobacteraceae bacterium]|nr:hypothetical protein [Ktedonobacteraceae bacterium]